MKDEINDWFEANYQNLRKNFKQNIANGQMSGYADDLLQICIETFLNKDIVMQEQMLRDDKIQNFLFRVASMQIKSGSSPFFRKYRAYYTRNVPILGNPSIEEEEPKEIMIKCIDREIKKLGWYEARLIQLHFFDGMSLRKITKTYGLPKGTLPQEFQKIYDRIKETCKNCMEE